MTTPFSIPIKNPQIDENARNIETIDSTAAFKNQNNIFTGTTNTFQGNLETTGNITTTGNTTTDRLYVQGPTAGSGAIVADRIGLGVNNTTDYKIEINATNTNATIMTGRSGINKTGIGSSYLTNYGQYLPMYAGATNGVLGTGEMCGYFINNHGCRRLILLGNGNAFHYPPNTLNNVLGVYGKGLATSGFTTWSDDRIKYNETDIHNSLEILNKLKPQKYEKIISGGRGDDWIPSDASWNEVKDKTDAEGNRLYDYQEEIGLIAQDIIKIPELAFCVGGEETDEEGNQTPLSLDYNNIFSLMIQAVKDLSAENKQLEARITALENK